MPSKPNEVSKEKPKARRGFAAMSSEMQMRIARAGGRKTARRYGKKYMSQIGKNGRKKREQSERKSLAKAA